jgi:hypothetical protein
MSIQCTKVKGLKLNNRHNYRKWEYSSIFEDFIAKLQLKPSLPDLRLHFEKSMAKMNDYLSYKAAKEITILVIHDKDDLEVPVKAAQHLRSFKKW